MFLLLFSCKEEDKTEAIIAEIPVELEIVRFDRLFAEANATDLPKLKTDFPYLFPEKYSDSLWLAKMEVDTLQSQLEEEVLKTFPDFDNETAQLKSFFQHVKYYFPDSSIPEVITIISEVRYNDRIILSDSILLIGLDNYLGTEHKFYQGLPNFVSKGLQKQFLISDVANTFAKGVVQYPRNRSFLSRMVYYGKELYLKDKLLPQNSDAEKINYLPEELDWAKTSEEQIWRYFIENELLYSTASELDRRFLDPAPFSKFRLELDSESPGRLGRYMGWQIVRAFAEKNPEVPMQEILQMPADEIFKKANYKPRKQWP